MVYRVPASTTKSPPNQKRLFGDQVAHASDRLLHGVTVAGCGHRTISALGASAAELGEVVRTAPERFFCAIPGSVVTGHSARTAIGRRRVELDKEAVMIAHAGCEARISVTRQVP